MLTKMWTNEKPLALLVGMQTGAASLGNSVEVVKKLKTELPYNPAITLLGIYPKDIGVLIHIGHIYPMFIEALPTIGKLW